MFDVRFANTTTTITQLYCSANTNISIQILVRSFSIQCKPIAIFLVYMMKDYCSNRRYRLSAIISTTMLVVVIGLQLITEVTVAAKVDTSHINCDVKSNQKIDRLMARLMIFNEKYGRNYPENSQQLKSYCNETDQIHNTIEAYKNRCFDGQLKQFSSLFIYSSRKNVKRWCGKGKKPKLNEFFKLSKCFNKNKRAYNQCMHNLVDALVGIKYAPNSKKIPHICCSTYEMLNCFHKEMSKGECNNQVDVMDQIIRGMFENGMGSTCGDYNDDSDKCQSLGKPPPKKSHEKVPDTVLYPFFDIIDSLP